MNAIAKANRLTSYMFLAPAVLVMGIALLYPIGYMVYASFLDWSPSQRIGQAEFIGLQNYANLLTDAAFGESVWVTLKFAFLVVTLEMLIGVGLALLLDRNIKGMSLLRTIFILPMMIAPIVVGLMWRYMYHPTVGIFNRSLKNLGFDEGIPWLSDSTWSFAAVVIADVWQWTPFIFILALAAMQSLPQSAIEAAEIDGATEWQKIFMIKLPLMMPVLIVTLLLRLIDAFKVLEVIMVLTNGGPGLSTEIVALRIFRTAQEFQELGEAAAMSNLLLMILMGLTIGMFAYSKVHEARAARMKAAAKQEEGE